MNPFEYAHDLITKNKYDSDIPDRKDYKQFLLNRTLSYHNDLIHYINELNRYPDISDKGHYDFIISRAVTTMPDFVSWVKNRVAKKSLHTLKNGILYLKGGDLTDELKLYKKATLYDLSSYFEEDFFETKKIVHLPLKYKG